MLQYNLKRLFQLKGISRPVVFLVNAGFTRGIATRLANNTTLNVSPSHIEKLCIAFKCTPNDLMEWTPDKPEQVNENNPLCGLISSSAPMFDLRNIGVDLPYDKLPEFAKKIIELKESILVKNKNS